MLRFLHFHAVAADRGDGLHPEFHALLEFPATSSRDVADPAGRHASGGSRSGLDSHGARGWTLKEIARLAARSNRR